MCINFFQKKEKNDFLSINVNGIHQFASNI